MRISVGALGLHYDLHGEGDPILLVHGFPLSGKLWEPIVRSLWDDYWLIVPDLRGHGRSDATPTATMGDYAGDLAALLDGIGESRPVILVGMSMGGYVAFEFCRRYPARVRALVLTNTRAQADTPEAAAGRRDTARKVRSEGSAVVAESMTPKLFGSRATPEMRAEWQEIMAATTPDGVAAALVAMAERPDSFGTLSGLNRPLLIIAGGEDAITPPADSERMHQAAPSSLLQVIAGAGHMTVVEQPEAFLSALRPFLSAQA